MKKITLITALLFVFAGISHAQNETKYSIAANVGIASGDAADVYGYSAGFGATGSYEYMQSDKLAYGGSAGFLLFSGDELTLMGRSADFSSTYTAVTITGFGKYYFIPNAYGIGRVGYNIASFSSDDFGGAVTVGQPEAGVTYGVGVGYNVQGFDISAEFNILAEELSSITLGVGYQF